MEDLQGLLPKLSQLLRSQGLVLESQRLDQAMERKATQGFNILVTGEFSRGKTTLLNALMGEEILAVSLLRLPIINVIEGGGGTRLAKVIRSGQASEVGLSDLANLQDASSVKLTWHNDLLQPGLQIMEYPSMSEPPNAHDFEAAVAQADLVVVVLAADSLYSNIEASAYERSIRANGHHQPFFAVNFGDRIAGKDQKEVQQAALVRLPVNADHIFFISTNDALEGDIHAQSKLAALREALQQAAGQREDIKAKRLEQLALLCIEQAETVFVEAAEQHSQNLQESEGAVQRIRKRLDGLREMRNELQDNLSELRNSTREIAQSKIRHFLRDLKFKFRGWVEHHADDKLTEHLNQLLKAAIEDFMTNDFKPFLDKRSQEQSALLNNGTTSFQHSLDDLYSLLPVDAPKLQMAGHGEINTSPSYLSVTAKEAGNTKPKAGFDFKKMLEVPESLIVLAVTAVGSILFRQLALLIAPTGVAFSALLASMKRKPTLSSADAAAFEEQVAKQASRMEAEIVREVVTQMDVIHDRTSNIVEEITKAAEQDARAHIQQLQDLGEPLDDRLAELSGIRAALEGGLAAHTGPEGQDDEGKT